MKRTSEGGGSRTTLPSLPLPHAQSALPVGLPTLRTRTAQAQRYG